ncbi:2-hydroxyglutaryl-CoA dehydratase [bacterium]|nr:2-hydroxyglutaryl-CoA dehydratase [bacterium]
MLTIGIDVGSTTSKIVLFDHNKMQIIDWAFTATGVTPKKTAWKLYQDILTKHKLEQVEYVVSTGYGRKLVEFKNQISSEIICHARGLSFLNPQIKTVIDIGGQDSKVISLDQDHKVVDFVMNDKCAAGTGRFLEVVATILETSVEDLSEMAFQAEEEIDIDSTCVVFAESEIIGMIAKGYTRNTIIKAVHKSIAKRIVNQVNSLNWQAPIAFTGGVSFNKSMKSILEEMLNLPLYTYETPIITGALGASLFLNNN